MTTDTARANLIAQLNKWAHIYTSFPKTGALLTAAATELTTLTARVEAAEGDSQRLEWVLTHRTYRVQGSDERGWFVLDNSNGLTFLTEKHPTYRAAIDAAIAAMTPPQAGEGVGDG